MSFFKTVNTSVNTSESGASAAIYMYMVKEFPLLAKSYDTRFGEGSFKDSIIYSDGDIHYVLPYMFVDASARYVNTYREERDLALMGGGAGRKYMSYRNLDSLYSWISDNLNRIENGQAPIFNPHYATLTYHPSDDAIEFLTDCPILRASFRNMSPPIIAEILDHHTTLALCEKLGVESAPSVWQGLVGIAQYPY